MAGADQFTAQQFIDAIPGTGGIISTIAKRVGCHWHTAQKYIENHASVKQAYQDECDAVLDVAESVIVRNIQLAGKLQKDTDVPVDTGDAKWYLTRKGKHRGYVERSEVTGAGGGPVAITTVEIVKDYGESGE